MSGDTHHPTSRPRVHRPLVVDAVDLPVSVWENAMIGHHIEAVERVVVAVDDGVASDAAMDWIIDRSSRVRLSVTLVTVMRLLPHARPLSEQNLRAIHEKALGSAGRRLHAAIPDVHVTQQFCHGEPVDELIAVSDGADLLVLGTRRSGRLTGIVKGTLPVRLLAQVHCALVVVPAGWAPTNGDIVVGWEQDDAGDGALEFAACEADRTHRNLAVVHAWTVPAIIDLGGFGYPPAINDVIDVHQAQLRRAADRIRRRFLETTVREVLVPCPTAASIIREALGASLVIVGNHGRGALGGYLLGSVSRAVLLAMPTVVAVVPHSSGSAPATGYHFRGMTNMGRSGSS